MWLVRYACGLLLKMSRALLRDTSRIEPAFGAAGARADEGHASPRGGHGAHAEGGGAPDEGSGAGRRAAQVQRPATQSGNATSTLCSSHPSAYSTAAAPTALNATTPPRNTAPTP